MLFNTHNCGRPSHLTYTIQSSQSRTGSSLLLSTNQFVLRLKQDHSVDLITQGIRMVRRVGIVLGLAKPCKKKRRYRASFERRYALGQAATIMLQSRKTVMIVLPEVLGSMGDASIIHVAEQLQ